MSATVHTHHDHNTAYTLAPETAHLAGDAAAEYRFRILQPDGAPLTSFSEVHEKKIHLIVVRRDLTEYWHLHPAQAGDGVWTVTLRLRPGRYQVFADFSPDGLGQPLTVSAALSVEGDDQPRALPSPARTFEIDDYEVDLAGALVPGKASRLVFSVRRDGRPVADLQPYLAAYGHLVAIRAGDLAYAHVHPDGSPGDGETSPGPDISFHAHVPESGTYRLFLDFQHGDVVRTAQFTIVADESWRLP